MAPEIGQTRKRDSGPQSVTTSFSIKVHQRLISFEQAGLRYARLLERTEGIRESLHLNE